MRWFAAESSCSSLAEHLGLLLQDVQLDTLALRQADHGLVALADDEHIGEACGKLVTCSIADQHDVEAALMLLLLDNGAYSPAVTATSHHDKLTNVEFDEVGDLASLNVNDDGVIDLQTKIPG